MAKGKVIKTIEHEGKPLKVIQYKDFSTSDRDPGEICPKCGGGMLCGDDDTYWCEEADDSVRAEPTCDFQYTLSEKESERELDKMLAEWDREAIEKTKERVKAGPPVFGEARPEEFELPSYGAKQDPWAKFK